jgi:UDP-GlcNAc:undecaprenyl-phosphate GlcNAc-1-phosphate transferase
MKTYLVAFIISFTAALLLVPLVKRAAFSLKVFGGDSENLVPRLGGVAIYFAFLIPLAGLFFYDNSVSMLFMRDARLMYGLFIGGTLTILLGAVDDFRNLSPFKKLIFEFFIGTYLYSVGFRITDISTPFGVTFSLGFWEYPLTLLWIIGIMNAMNLIDGIDGLATGISFFAVITVGAISISAGNVLNILLCSALAGALLGFIRYNFNPAQIYLGDSGSLFLGYVLAIMSIWGSQKATTVVGLLTPIIAFGLPILDMVVSILRRYFRGLPIFQRDREHIHHRLRSLGFSQRKVVLILYAFCIVLNMFALITFVSNNPTIILLALVIGAIFGLKYLGYINTKIIKDRFEEFSKIRKERYCRYILRELIRNPVHESFKDRIWSITKGFAEKCHYEFIRLEIIRNRNGLEETDEIEWISRNKLSGEAVAKIVLPLIVNERRVGTLEAKMTYSFSKEGPGMLSAAELLAEEISRLLAVEMKNESFDLPEEFSESEFAVSDV